MIIGMAAGSVGGRWGSVSARAQGRRATSGFPKPLKFRVGHGRECMQLGFNYVVITCDLGRSGGLGVLFGCPGHGRRQKAIGLHEILTRYKAVNSGFPKPLAPTARHCRTFSCLLFCRSITACALCCHDCHCDLYTHACLSIGRRRAASLTSRRMRSTSLPT